MRHVTIELSEAQEVALSERMVAGGFASVEAYVAALVEAEVEGALPEHVEAMLLEALDGPNVNCSMDEMFDRLDRELRQSS